MEEVHTLQLRSVTEGHTRMDAAYTLHTGPNILTVYPGMDSAVSIVGRDGLIATVLTGTGELEVRLEQHGEELWKHTFVYTLPAPTDDEHDQSPSTPNGHTPSVDPPLRRPRGRPRMNTAPPRRAMNLDGEAV